MCYYNGTVFINELPECKQLDGVQKCSCKEDYKGDLCNQCKEDKNCGGM